MDRQKVTESGSYVRTAKRAKTETGPRKYYRKIDSLGRVTLPSKIRKSFELKADDTLRFFTKDTGEIILMKDGPSCTFCGNPSDLIQVRGINVCPDCLKDLKKLAETGPDF